jgi:hypothetical protein
MTAGAAVDVLAAVNMAIEWHNDNCAIGEELTIARADHPEPGCADCGHRSDCATHDEPAMPAGRCNCGKVTRRTDEQMEALHEQARAYARSAAGDAFDGIPSLIELDSVLSMLSDAYMSGWSKRDGRGGDLTPEQIADAALVALGHRRDDTLSGMIHEGMIFAARIARGEVSL